MSERLSKSAKEFYRGVAPVVGMILEVNRHPHADRLYLATVDVDQPNTVHVIFGGDRVLKKHERVAVALPGTILPNGEKIRKRKWRGVLSEGELLSADELGVTLYGPDSVAVLNPREGYIGQSLDNAQAMGDVTNTLYDFTNHDMIPYLLGGAHLHRFLPRGHSVVSK